MPTNGSCARSTVAAATVVAALWTVGAGAQSIHDVSIVLDRVGARLEQYYKRVQNIVCTEKTTTQNVSRDMSPYGFARLIESELRVEPDDDDGSIRSEPKVVRSVRKVNGRVPKLTDKEACYDPNPLSTEPLAFLLPANREEYAFTWAGFGKGKDQHAMLIDFRARSTGKTEVKEHPRDREHCLSFSMPGGTRGRIWIDSSTHEVLRIEERLIAPVDFRIPVPLQRRHSFPDFVTIDRHDMYIKYKSVTFDDPSETMLLPESIEEVVMWRGGGTSYRVSQTFSDYRRFLTGARVIK